jgi:hypothetical protein
MASTASSTSMKSWHQGSIISASMLVNKSTNSLVGNECHDIEVNADCEIEILSSYSSIDSDHYEDRDEHLQ